ncbi:MAG TPA: ribonuclease III [Rhizomicrobium sp.]|jgi:ribonuclease-3|nr:ribonuclease III [Rhizomicrobium sp.]
MTASSPGSTDLEARLGHAFADQSLLRRALTHASVTSSASNNERLEFLGDRVLGLIIAGRLYEENAGDAEGVLALKLNALVRQEACAAAFEAAGLAEHLVLARAEMASGGRKKAVILAGACEAVIAALYLDGGMPAAKQFVDRYWTPLIGALGREMRDAKTALQEWAQARKGGTAPVYKQVGREGPDHAPRFSVEVSTAGQESQVGEGGSKREAEQAAARKMLVQIGEWTE